MKSSLRFLIAISALVYCANAQPVTWQKMSNFPSNENARTIAVSPSTSTLYVGAGSGNLYKSTDNGVTWALQSGTLTQPSGGYAFTSLLFSSNGTLIGGGSPQPFWYTGSAWTQGTGASTDLTMYITKDNSGNLVGGVTFSGATNYSTDNGHTWTVRTNTGGAVFSIFKARNGCIYVGGEVSGVHRTCDSGQTWTNLGLPTGGINDGANVHGIAEDAHGRIYAACRGGVSRWVSGTTWIDITSIPRRNAITGTGDINVRSIMKADNDVMIAATDSGIFCSIDNGSNFALCNTGVTQQVPANGDRNMMIQDPVTGYVYIAAATDGVTRSVNPVTVFNVQADDFVANRKADPTGSSCAVPNPPTTCLWFQGWTAFSTPTFSFSNNIMNVLYGNNDQPQLDFRGSKASNAGVLTTPCTTANGCSYNKAFITSGIFQPTTNKFRLSYTCDVSSPAPPAGTANGVQGGYYGNFPGDTQHVPHYYAYMNPTFVSGHTLNIVWNNKPQHNNCCGGTDEYTLDPEFNNPTTAGEPFHFFDGTAAMYLADDFGGNSCGRGNELCNGPTTGHNCQVSNAFWGTTINEPDAWVASLEASYGGTVAGVVSTTLYELNWASPKLVPHGVIYDTACSTTTAIRNLGFSNASITGSVTSFDNLAYTNTRWQTPAMAQSPTLYCAIRPHMVVASISNASPPVATFFTAGSTPSAPMYHSLTDGDLVTVAGVSGGSLNGSLYAHVLNNTQVSLFTDQALAVPAAAAAYTCPTQCTITSAMDFTNFSEIAISDVVSLPSITTASPLPGADASVAYSQTISAVGGTPPYSWSVTIGTLPSGLSINSSTGAITGSPNGAPGTSTFTVQVSDANLSTFPKQFDLTVNVLPSITTNQNLAQATTHVSYSPVTLAATGGVPPYSWSITSGALPTGMSLSAAGVISGTPTSFPATFSPVVQVTDSANGTAPKTFTLVLVSDLAISSASPLPDGSVGTAYSQTLLASGGFPPDTWSLISGTLPNGLALSSAGVLSGTPSHVGNFTFTPGATDIAPTAVSKLFTMAVTSPCALTTTTPLPNGTIGVSYGPVTLQVSGCVNPVSFTITVGTITPGLTLHSTTGVIDGTPTGAPLVWQFTVTVTDNAGASPATQYQLSTVTAPVTPGTSVTNTQMQGTVKLQ